MCNNITPGPWKVKIHEEMGFTVHTEEYGTIAVVYGENAEANASFIAEAVNTTLAREAGEQ